MKRIGIQKGFSLIELLIVIALIAIMMGFAVPTWQRYAANSDLKTAAREVKADLFNVRQRAVEENVDFYRLTFNTVGNSYVLTRSDTGVTVWTKSLAALGKGITINAVNFSGGSVISFQRRGTMSQWGSVTLRNSIGSTATVTVNITGRSHVDFTMQ